MANLDIDRSKDSVANVFGGASEEVCSKPNCLEFEHGEENSVEIDSITDAEAEKLLPGYAFAFEDYHLHRSEGDAPQEALQKTLADWRVFWASNAYVPHRRQL